MTERKRPRSADAARRLLEAAELVRRRARATGDEELGRAHEGLVAIARELEATYRSEAAGALAQSTPRPRPFWERPGGTKLARVVLDREKDRLTVKFLRGGEYSLALARLHLQSRPARARLHRSRGWVLLDLENGATWDMASDFFLYECEPTYRAVHGPFATRPSALGKRIRELRLGMGLKAVEVAEAAGLARSNYARLEAGRHEARVDTLVRVAAALRVPLSELLAPPGSPPAVRLTDSQAARLARAHASRAGGAAESRSVRSPERNDTA